MVRYGVLVTLIAVVLAGCSSKPKSRYSVEHDYGPKSPVDVSHVKDAVPRVEPKSRGGNKSPYRVLGKTYHIMPSSLGYKERGGASWYGKKFHGHLTSNGERYDMYAMSAAHKSLPLPTFVKVTNLANGRQVIVRVNDRGPFHPGRIIDLSYAAASKLGMLAQGTAQVEVEAIDPARWQSSQQVLAAEPPTPAPTLGRFVQAGAFSNEVNARALAARLEQQLALPGKVVSTQAAQGLLYRVYVGPLKSDPLIEQTLKRLATLGVTGARLVDLPQ